MAADLRVRAEIEKLARLLGEQPERFAYLQKLSAEEIQRIREAATDRLFDADRHTFERLAGSSRLIPDGLAATLSQKVFGPLFSARMTGVVPVSTAVRVSKRLPHDFLADIAVLLDPRRASEVIAALPADQVAKTSRRLAEREEWVTMGRFVGHLNQAALKETIRVLSPEAMLRTGFVMEELEVLPRTVALLEDKRLEELLRVAVEKDLLDEAAVLFGGLDDAQRERVRDAAGRTGLAERLAPVVEGL